MKLQEDVSRDVEVAQIIYSKVVKDIKEYVIKSKIPSKTQ